MRETLDFSVVMPCRNESHHIREALQDIANAARCPYKSEVLIADGQSDDGTIDEIKEAASDCDFGAPITIIENEKKVIPVALNLLVERARGKYIIRVDCHSRLGPNYFSEIVEALSQNTGDVVGPRIIQVPSGDTLVARTIAQFLNTRLGSGGTASRGSSTRPVEVVHSVMSCFRREVWEKIGGYDETLLSNEDFDFDYRAFKAGYRIVSLPSPVFMLKARSSVRELAKQRWRYGYWKAQFLKKEPRAIRLRQLIPAIIPFGVLVLLFQPVILAGLLFIYALVTVKSTYPAARTIREKLVIPLVGLAVAVVTHFVWSFGLYWGFIRKRQS